MIHGPYGSDGKLPGMQPDTGGKPERGDRLVKTIDRLLNINSRETGLSSQGRIIFLTTNQLMNDKRFGLSFQPELPKLSRQKPVKSAENLVRDRDLSSTREAVLTTSPAGRYS